MAIRSEVYKQTVKKKGYWNYKDAYDFCHDWFKRENYNLEEHIYTEKLSDRGKEIILKWKAWKKVTDYFKFVIWTDWHILGMNDAEIERDGKKDKTNKGEFKMKISGELEKDWEDRWEKQPFWKFLRGVYEKYIIRVTVDEYEDRVIDKTGEFVSEFKAFLEI